MSFQIDLGAWNQVFIVPAAVVDPESRETLWENPAARESSGWQSAPGVPISWEGKPALLLTVPQKET